MEYTRENRRYARLNFFCELRVTPMPNGKPMPASSIDLSAGGVGLYANYSLNREQLVQIDFHLRDEKHREVVESVLGKVAYARSDEDGTRIGVEFLKTIQEADYPALAKRLQELVSD
jgi:c-di-GMP-binding flagellar brake protein YcgR